jgi:multidrug efflux system membrane fusion protein
MNNDHNFALSKPRVKRHHIALFSTLVLLSLIGTRLYFEPLQSAQSNEKPHQVGGSKHHHHDDGDKPVVITVETASTKDFSVYLNALGTVTPLRSVTVRPRVEGEITRIVFTEGQNVKAGDLLAEIDPRPLQIQLQQAEGQLLRDEALLSNAQIDSQRYQTLLAQDAIAAQQTATQAAQVKQYQGIVEMDKAQVNNAKLQLSYTKLTAPISGRVGLRQIDQGNMIHNNDTNGVAIITQLQPISVVFTLPEDKVPSILQRRTNGKSISVSVYDRANKEKLAEGELVALDNQIDAQTGTLKLKAQFTNLDGRLFANQFVNVRMHVDTLTNAVQISSAAIQNDEHGTYVYVVTPEKTVQLRRVKLGDIEGDKAVILENLAANDVVALEGVDKLHEGSQIDIAQKDGQAVAPTPDNHPTSNDKAHKKH